MTVLGLKNKKINTKCKRVKGKMLEKNVTTAQIETTTTQCMQEILQQMYFIKMTKI